MTLTDTVVDATTLTYDQVALDLYRDIHKGIRAELFAITLDAGRTDPADRFERQALAAQVSDVMDLLVQHAEHEDVAIGPALETHLPDDALRIAADHVSLEARIESLRDQAASAVDGDSSGLDTDRRAVHRLYVELGAFTSAYLAHQDLEERVVMPALQEAIGVEAVVAIHQSIVGPMPPAEMARSLAVMLPAMNVDDRTELLGGIAANAPAEVMDGIWSLTRSVLGPADVAALAPRLGR